MASSRGKKLSDAYIELRADDSKLAGDVKVSATKAGKGFGSQMNRALANLKLDPIDVKADPASALAAIETTRDRLRDMSRDADSVEMRVRTERALTQMDRFRKALGQVDDEPVVVDVDPSPARRQVDLLRRQLTALGVDPVDVDADPKAALAAIKRVDEQLRKVSTDAGSIQVRVDAEQARAGLTRLRQQIDVVGDDAAKGFAARFGARVGPLIASLPLSPPMLIAVAAAAGVAAPLLAGALAAGVVGGAGVGGILGGVLLAARDQRVKDAGASLGAFILGDLEARAAGFVPPVLDGIDDIRAGWRRLGPDLDRIFASSRYIDPLVAGAVSGARKLIGGVADAVDEAEAPIAAFGAGLDRMGDATGDVLTLLAQDADEGAAAINDLTVAIATLIRVTGGIVHAGASVKGWADGLDTVLDRTRYMIEDQSNLNDMFELFGGKLDITADGFSRGSREAEAYRKVTLGTATAADFAALKLGGMTDAEIAAADASGTYRARTDEVNEALGRASGRYVETAAAAAQLQARMKVLGEVDAVARGEMDALLTSTGSVTGAMQAQKKMADLLRDAHEQMFGAVINQTEANEGYEESWDNLSETVKGNADQIKNNRDSLDLHSKAGRSNRDALQELLIKSGEMYYADIAAGVAIGEATKKHEARIGKIRTEAGELRLNKTETDKLITTYGKIPPDKTTKLLVDGLEQIGRSLTDLYIFQRSLATGRTLAQVRSDLFGGYAGDPRAFKREGGPIEGSGLKGVDSKVIVAAPGEFMQPVPAVDYYGVAAMQALRHRQIPREALQGYATGGLIDQLRGRDWGSRMRYEIDVHGSRIPSRDQVAAAVIPEFGAWPSSPGAQRGDSGVWRQIMALVRGSGIPYTFGNAYRPGDPLWHGCVPMDTRILTRRGWITYDQVRLFEDETVGYNPATGKNEWTRIVALHRYEDAELWTIGNTWWTAEVTPGHKWLVDDPRTVQLETVCTECGREFTTGRGMTVHRARAHKIYTPRVERYEEDLVETRHFRQNTRIHLSKPAELGSTLPITDQEAELIGWIMADGYMEPKGPTIVQSKPEQVEYLRTFMRHFPHTIYLREPEDRQNHLIYRFALPCAFWDDLATRSGASKQRAADLVMEMSTSQREAWLRGFLAGDGTRDPRTRDERLGYSAFQVSGPVAEAVKLAAYLEGYRPDVRVKSTFDADHYGRQPIEAVGLRTPISKARHLRRLGTRRATVWCPTTDLGTWTARQGEEIFLTGNSGRAVDFMGYNQDRLAGLFMSMQSRLLELIHRTDSGDYAITRGRRTTMPSQLPLHRNHLHVAMANGGVIGEPVFGVGQSGRSYSFGERGPETVTPGRVLGGDVHFHFHGPVASKKGAQDMVLQAYEQLKRERKI